MCRSSRRCVPDRALISGPRRAGSWPIPGRVETARSGCSSATPARLVGRFWMSGSTCCGPGSPTRPGAAAGIPADVEFAPPLRPGHQHIDHKCRCRISAQIRSPRQANTQASNHQRFQDPRSCPKSGCTQDSTSAASTETRSPPEHRAQHSCSADAVFSADRPPSNSRSSPGISPGRGRVAAVIGVSAR